MVFRKRFLALVFGLFLLSGPAVSQVKGDGFAEFFKGFQEAVAKNDKDKVAALSGFPHFNWEEGLGDDVSRETFLKNFEKLLTPEIRQKIAEGKFYKTDRGDYLKDWKHKGDQYTLVFDRQPSGDFKFSGLLVGPY